MHVKSEYINTCPRAHSKNPFITAYMKSILLAKDTIVGQWSECTWDKSKLNIEALVYDDEVNTLAPMHPIHI